MHLSRQASNPFHEAALKPHCGYALGSSSRTALIEILDSPLDQLYQINLTSANKISHAHLCILISAQSATS